MRCCSRVQTGAANRCPLLPPRCLHAAVAQVFSYRNAATALAEAGFSLRCGCTCNPGACYGAPAGRSAGPRSCAQWCTQLQHVAATPVACLHPHALGCHLLPAGSSLPRLVADCLPTGLLGVRDEEVRDAADQAQGNFRCELWVCVASFIAVQTDLKPKRESKKASSWGAAMQAFRWREPI